MKFSRQGWVRFLVVACLVGVVAIRAQAQEVAPKTQKADFQLTGVWAGVAYLDEEKLKAKLDALTTDDEKKQFAIKAELFMSAVAAFQFSADGRFESDVEMNTDAGQNERAMTNGTYRIVESEGPKFVVEFVEKLADGKNEREKKLIQFYDDGEHLAVLVPAPEELADCNPLMIFERVPAENLVDPDSIAKEQSKTQIK